MGLMTGSKDGFEPIIACMSEVRQDIINLVCITTWVGEGANKGLIPMAKQTEWKTETYGGVLNFLATAYIPAVHAAILTQAGLPFEGALVGAILTSIIGTFIAGRFNLPLLLLPGMGINALFTYTLVLQMGLSWQGALAVSFVSGALVVLLTVTKVARKLANAFPPIIHDGLTVGLGLFLILIGLEAAGIVSGGGGALLHIGDLGERPVQVAFLSLFVAILLFLKMGPSSFLWTIAFGVGLSAVMGTLDWTGEFALMPFFESFGTVFGNVSFAESASPIFLVAVGVLTLVLLIENISLIQNQTRAIGKDADAPKGLVAQGLSTMAGAMFGSSPTVSTVEVAAGISVGARGGIASFVTSGLYVVSLLLLPLFAIIPVTAIAPVLIIIGMMMFQNVKHLPLDNWEHAFPAILVIIMIPFTYSIVDGIGLGFIAYTMIVLFKKGYRSLSPVVGVLTVLFLVFFSLPVWL